MAWSAAAVITAWESAAGLTAPVRAAVLLQADGRAPSTSAALALDVGTAAALLVASYTDAFGPVVDAVLTCPACGQPLEASVELPPASPGPASARIGDWQVRLPTLGELAAVVGRPDAAGELRARCLSPLAPDGPDVPPDEVDAVVEELAGAALIHGRVRCPACGATCDAGLDPAVLVWDRVRSAAPRLLAEVATLASAFGWSEEAILGLPAQRRAAYLTLAGGRP
jgi:hypothetical protein